MDLPCILADNYKPDYDLVLYSSRDAHTCQDKDRYTVDLRMPCLKHIPNWRYTRGDNLAVNQYSQVGMSKRHDRLLHDKDYKGRMVMENKHLWVGRVL